MLVILLVLGTGFYAVVSSLLEDASVARLEARIAEIIPDGPQDLDDMPPLELVMGGASSGTFAYLVSPDGLVLRPLYGGPDGLPDGSSISAGLTLGRDLRTTVLDGVPFRVLSLPIAGSVSTPRDGRVSIAAIQVVEDRAAEQGVLDLIVDVLIVGGIAAVLFAMIAGAFYARRALVPIRDALTVRRSALRRQRDFAADASHELRTPLTIIRASAEDLRAHADEPVGSVGTALHDIEIEAMHVSSLVDDLLLLARSESGALGLDLQPVELGDIAASVTAGMTGTAAKRDVVITTDPEPVMVSGDAVRLRQLITIVVDNAVRHSPTAGTVTVRVRQVGKEAELTVDDEGPGIHPDDLPHVFDRFWRGRYQQRDGAGLGLAIARSIVSQHEGSIAVSNRPQGGARFTVRLPSSPAESAAVD